MGADSDLKLEAFRKTVLDEAQRDARERLQQVEESARRKVDAARQKFERLMEEARGEGRESAERETRRRRSEARREARAQVLRVRHEALERLRERTLQRFQQKRGDNDYRRFMSRLERIAREQLGDEARIEPDADAGGLVARCEGRLVDYRLPAVVDRALEDLGAELEELWR